jgi:hypothetical protein
MQIEWTNRNVRDATEVPLLLTNWSSGHQDIDTIDA